ncbi:MAG TPA: sigma-70 family RNA polymerase sigma factor [Phototrophicaceae bacterium]|nr:sigma-70 family RNA polymerase sigma factor [Phototrophicaceae bacterium]
MLLEDELSLLEALRDGDEQAFERLIEAYQASMVRVALLYVPTRTLAEEAVQETWIGVLKGLNRFEGRSSLKTWIFSILMNRAKTIAQREGRYQQIAWEEDDSEPSVSPTRFRMLGSDYPDHWKAEDMPDNWDAIPEEVLLNQETRRYIQQAINALPESQRIVITLRDVELLTSDEVCNILSISETNQRVLLHRARSKVRQSLELYLSES